MIQLIHRKNINIQKWNRCIELATNGMPYAYHWYLDAVTGEQWEALVVNDYETVMPLPYNRKLIGLKQVYHPFFTQQLGVFSTKPIHLDVITSFFESIPHSYVRFYSQVNFANPIENLDFGFQIETRNNFILPLNQPYETLYASFSKGIKYSIKKGIKWQHHREQLDVETFISFFEKSEIPDMKKIMGQLKRILKPLLPAIEQRGIGYPVGLFSKEGHLLAALFLLKSHGRLIYLLSRSTQEGKKKRAMAFLIHSIIKEHAEMPYIFDFEGSNIPSLIEFFTSFGAVNQTYWSVFK